MVCLCTAHIACILTRAQHRLLDAGLLVSGFGSIGTAVNFIATILCMRCPGMALGKMPLLAWLNLVMAGMVILAVSPLTAAQIMLSIDRYLGAHFFDSQAEVPQSFGCISSGSSATRKSTSW